MEFTVEIRKLSSDFAISYPPKDYPELLLKQGRPYTCLLLKTDYDFYICIPFRSSINHKYAYMFRNTKRSRITKSGLDYTKMVLLKNQTFLSNDNVVVDTDEYKETIMHIEIIAKEAVSYLESYINHVKGKVILNKNEFDRRYKYSTLAYFHKIIFE